MSHLLSSQASGPFQAWLKDALISEQSEYAVLKRLVKEKGLFDRQPRFYASQALIMGSLLIAGFAGLFLFDALWLRLLNAAFLAIMFTQVGYFVHDSGHRQIFTRPRENDLVYLLSGFLVGMSGSWWRQTHNEHHASPNDLALDPHTAIPGLAFSPEQAESKQGMNRVITRYQAYFFYPMLLLEGLGLRLASIQFLAAGKARYPRIEAFGMLAHFVVYGALVFGAMGVAQGIIFIVAHQMLAGLYLGSVFAPNHKGMPIIPRESPIDFLRRQVLTTRNVRPHLVTDIWCGGLNYQIEHHLFPTLPRNKLGEARTIVQAFCAERSIPYVETGLFESYRIIFRHLDDVVEPLHGRAAIARPIA